MKAAVSELWRGAGAAVAGRRKQNRCFTGLGYGFIQA
jgi:hypothetical protein